MRPSTMARGAALGSAAALIALSASPAFAADHVAQASARAITVDVAGQSSGVEGFTSTHDGTSESTFGTNQPAVQLLGGQELAEVGTLAQDATTGVDGSGRGVSAACSGLAGDGASVVEVGEGSCLTGGDNLQLEVATLDLTGLQIFGGQVTEGVPNLQQELAAAGLDLDLLLEPLSGALQQAVTSLGEPGIYLDLGAVTSQCQANGREVSGDSQLAGASLYLQLPGGFLPEGDTRLDILALPVDPGPNTKVVTGLDDVVATLTQGLRYQVENALEGQLEPLLTPVLDQLDPVLQEISGQLAAQLAPVEENLIDATLNAQTVGDGEITVTALDLRVLPAAAEFIGSDLLHLQLATSSCGPNFRVAADTPAPAPEQPAPVKPVADTPPAKPGVPTVVTAGLESAPADGPSATTLGLVGLLVLGSTGAGLLVYRRSLSS